MEPDKVVPYFGSVEKPECHTVSYTHLILMAAKPGGPFKTQRRTIYCILYLTLFLVTGIAMILNRNFWRREKKNYHLYLYAELVYAAFICFWGCCVTLNDQLGGNDLSVFTYMMRCV